MAGSLERPVFQTNAGITNFAYGGPAAILPLHQRRYDFYVWRGLGIRLGQQDDWPWHSFEESLAAIVAPLGMSWQDFSQAGLYCPPPSYCKFEQEDSPEPRFATPSGKIEFYSELLAELGASPLPVHIELSEGGEEYPFILITGARKQPYWASSFRYLEGLKPAARQAEAEICEETARTLGLSEGQKVLVETRHGSATFTLRIKIMRPGVVNVDYGWWFPLDEDLAEPQLGGMFRSNANVLTSATFEETDPLLGQWSYNGIPCRIQPVDS
jgi:anaerobic selenocysteine-containing dehydrogenase